MSPYFSLFGTHFLSKGANGAYLSAAAQIHPLQQSDHDCVDYLRLNIVCVSTTGEIPFTCRVVI